MKFDLCVETFFKELSIPERVQAVKKTGFPAIELWAVDREKATAYSAGAQKSGIPLVSCVVNGPTGEPGGCPIRPEEREKYLAAVQTTAELMKSVGCQQLITCTGNLVAGRSPQSQRACLIEALRSAGDIAGKYGVTLVLETLNTRTDHAGYFLDSLDEGAAIVRAVNHPQVKLLMDIYHTQIMQGDIIKRIREHIDVIGHFHSAGVPGRHELFEGELNYPAILEVICSTKYAGYFGLEYMPRLADRESLEKTWAMLAPFADHKNK
jgi:hydroxypyruvate isomerase